MKLKHIIAAIVLPVLTVACQKQKDAIPAPPEPVVNLYSLMYDFQDMDSAEQIRSIAEDSATVAAFLKTITDLPADRETVLAWSGSRAVEVFTPAVDSVFGDGAASARALGRILTNASDAELYLPRRTYANVVYGRPESLLFVDSVMLIALNHYLGEDYPGYSHRPEYIRKTKTPEMLPYDIAEALIATEYPYQGGNDATLLSRLVYEGVLAHAKTVLTGTDNPAMALGYTKEEYKELIDSEKAIWKSLVQKRLVYDTSESTAHKLIDPSPSVNILDMPLPGRVGRFIGYRIVESYLKKHPETTLSEMLNADFYNSSNLLSVAGY